MDILDATLKLSVKQEHALMLQEEVRMLLGQMPKSPPVGFGLHAVYVLLCS